MTQSVALRLVHRPAPVPSEIFALVSATAGISSTSTIEVGFARYNSTCVSCGGYTLDAGIDNWRVVINFEDLNTDTPSDDGPSDTPRVPAPGALVLLAIGVTTLGALRRLR